jgi:hypothetical protein
MTHKLAFEVNWLMSFSKSRRVGAGKNSRQNLEKNFIQHFYVYTLEEKQRNC